MIYTSYEDMSNTIRRNIWKIPIDVDLIVGVPRSGMICALMIAELLNKHCSDLDAFIEGRKMSCGRREGLIKRGMSNKILVVDDTVYSGKAMKIVRERLKSFEEQYNIIYCCIYAEGENSKQIVDIYFEENHKSGEKMYLYEWNILHHYPKKTKVSMWDIDGLVCKDPPDDKNIYIYESYLVNPIPMIIPNTFVGAFVTYRLEKYRNVTKEWLESLGIEYGQLLMFNAPNREIRNKTIGPGEYKGQIYKNANWAELFVESDEKQAEKIFNISRKPVFCYSNGKLYK